MSRIATAAALLGCCMLPVVGAAQVGIPNVRGLHKPTGTTCRTVHTWEEKRSDASCAESGRRSYEVKELECSHFKDGHVDARFNKLEDRPRACVPADHVG